MTYIKPNDPSCSQRKSNQCEDMKEAQIPFST